MKTLAELQVECATLGISVLTNGRASKDAYITALRDYHWRNDHPGEPLPPQIMPMLLSDWNALDPSETEQIEQDGSGWIAQPKLDGVRALLHAERGGTRITSRCVSEVTYRLGEFQDNLLHLTTGLEQLADTILDGELVCPVSTLDTGSNVAMHPLQATTAILATSPANARQIQNRHGAHLHYHVFDILRFRGADLTKMPLHKRQDHLNQALVAANNPYFAIVPSYIIGKTAVHWRTIEAGGEGTVWKRADQTYEAGRRVNHWIKRKGSIQLEAVVTGFKPGTAGKGHEHLVGAVEFSAPDAEGKVRPVAWISNWPDETRDGMTEHDPQSGLRLNPAYVGREAVITGQEWSAKSRRLRSARLLRWL